MFQSAYKRPFLLACIIVIKHWYMLITKLSKKKDFFFFLTHGELVEQDCENGKEKHRSGSLCVIVKGAIPLLCLDF